MENMKTLIVYYSNTGNNELLVFHLQKKLQCEILKIEEAGRRSGLTIFLDIVFNRTPKLKEHAVQLNQYDHIIFAGPIWAGRIASPLRAFMRSEKSFIKSYSFITFCGGGSNEQIEKIRSEVKVILGIPATIVEELWISRLPVKTGITSSYQASAEDLGCFEKQVDEFLRLHLTPVEIAK
jgi:flavodoxin